VAGSLRETELEVENVELRVEIAALRERIEELERRLSQDSRNSSRPPSSDPPMTRQQRRALAREKAKRSLTAGMTLMDASNAWATR
jgi:transposase